MRVIITGANRGIGHELAVQYLARGDTVEATVRHMKTAVELRALNRGDGRLNIHTLDVRDEQAIAAMAQRLDGVGIDVLINNAGIGGHGTGLEELSMSDLIRYFDTNTLGALRMVKHLLPNMRRGATKKIVAITSGMGSIKDNTSGGAYGYRMSKAALNMAHRSMAVDLQGEGFTVVVINPGWVQTDMGGRHAPTPVADSASKMVALIDRIGPEDNGSFLDYRGHGWPW